MNRKWSVFTVGALLTVAVMVSACAPGMLVMPALTPAMENSLISVDETGSTSIDAPALREALNTVKPATALSEDEAEGLLFMREEEKLARDVYLALYEEWGVQIFQNIARSEQTHMDALLTLIERYGLADPAAGRDAGDFANQELQHLYDQLVAQGGESLEAALRVGAAIEEIDILDLEEEIALTDKADIELVYDNLMKGSRNHLRSFVRTLSRQTGVTYEPQYLSPEAYEAIVGGSTERGRGRGG
jgi:hypothetical protein